MEDNMNNVEFSTENNINLDESAMEMEYVEVPKTIVEKSKVNKKKIVKEPRETIFNCLRNERILVRRVPKLSGIWGNNPKHVLSGGMAENASRTYVVPRLASGAFVNILTNAEKEFLEEVMGLEYNSLSIYKKVDNFWDDGNPNGINRVKLTKGDNYFNLSDPEDYIKYKILLANKDYIASSLTELENSPKATYEFVMIAEEEETKSAKLNMSTTMQCYKEFGKIEDDADTLRVIIETISGKPLSKTSKIDFLKIQINNLIQSDSKLFLKIITDTMLPTKVLIKKCIEAGIISNRGSYLYYNGNPLCEDNEEPTLNIAAKYLNSPKRQEIKFTLEAKLK